MKKACYKKTGKYWNQKTSAFNIVPKKGNVKNIHRYNAECKIIVNPQQLTSLNTTD